MRQYTASMIEKKVGLIGLGSIGQSIIKSWPTGDGARFKLAALFVRTQRIEEARASVPPCIEVTDSFEKFLVGLQVVVEAAGHSAVLEHAESVLRRGIDFVLLSVGCLADDAVANRLQSAARDGQSRVLLPVGAIAGLDGLLALRHAGLRRVKYTSMKPPGSWRGTPAERLFNLDALEEPTVIFSGTARQAAALYPKNANVTAAVALAGLGFDSTQVDLVADPGSSKNVGHIQAEGATSTLTVIVSGSSAPGNPKTSQITGMSVLSAFDNDTATVSFF